MTFTQDDIWIVRERLPLPSDVKSQTVKATGWIRNALYEFTFAKDYVTVAKRGRSFLQLCVGWKLIDIESKE